MDYYKDAEISNDQSKVNRDRAVSDENMQRFFDNLGRKDKLTPPRLMGLINEQHKKRDIEIGQMRYWINSPFLN